MNKIVKTKIVMIMRHPCLMEDEGRTFFIAGPMPETEAREWIKNQKDEYFKPGNYFLVNLGMKEE